MKEISLNILDIAQNSITALAKKIILTVSYDLPADRLLVRVADDGKGMSEEFLSMVTDPFTTTRKTRKVGLGIPLFKLSAEQTGGSFKITSKLGVGTTTEAVYVNSSIDRMPLGDLADTVCVLINAAPNVCFILDYSVNNEKFTFDTDEAKQILGDDVPLSTPEVLDFLRDYINQGINSINGGKEII